MTWKKAFPSTPGTIELKQSVWFRIDKNAYTIKKVKHIKDSLMCELIMQDGDKIMRPLDSLADDVREKVTNMMPTQPTQLQPAL